MDGFKHLPNLRSAFDGVIEKNQLAARVPVNTLGFLVAEGFDELDPFIGMAMNVANQAVHMFAFLVQPHLINRCRHA